MCGTYIRAQNRSEHECANRNRSEHEGVPTLTQRYNLVTALRTDSRWHGNIPTCLAIYSNTCRVMHVAWETGGADKMTGKNSSLPDSATKLY